MFCGNPIFSYATTILIPEYWKDIVYTAYTQTRVSTYIGNDCKRERKKKNKNEIERI